jgi:diketogulonate reductase-like aldo/keto reductase
VHIVLKYSLAPIDFVQLKYSVIDPVKGTDLEKLVLLNPKMKETLARLLPKAVIFAYSPLLGGNVFEKTAKDQWPSGYDSIQNRRKVREIQLKAKELGVSPSAYVLKQIADQGVWPITTTGNAERLKANLKLFSVKDA